MEFYLNGEKRNYDGDPDLNLMEYLRNTEKIISPKDGCSPEGVCGCCTVLLDNKAVKSCISAMKRVEGKQVLTTEGLSPEKRETVVNAFMEKGGLQCGFCTPGILMKVWPLFEKPEQPCREDFVKALNSNLCRCTGFKKIVDSCMHAADAFQQGKQLTLPAYSGKLGDSLPKYDSKRLATGHAPYVADVELEGMLHGALKFSDHPRAKVLSIDLSEASEHSGVESILTSEDIPGARHTGLIVQDWPLMIKAGEETRYIGDVLAIVVADKEKNAREAVQKIQVDYEVLTPVTDPKLALEGSSPQVHSKGNILSDAEIHRGDLENARQKSAFISSGTYSTQRIEHAFMEMECCLATPWEQGVEVYSQSQGVYEDRKSISSILGLPQEQVRVKLMPNGGGFGGKED
ncbi:MAG: molybdopterin-dependent oxidoreductase, partial [SAR324 cluster bacterium]|nr:molybdopterin-dependent oxidoreductase [SAR324 cluster bacterium]